MTRKEAVECLKNLCHKEAASHNRVETMALRKAIRCLNREPLKKATDILLVTVVVIAAFFIGTYV